MMYDYMCLFAFWKLIVREVMLMWGNNALIPQGTYPLCT